MRRGTWHMSRPISAIRPSSTTGFSESVGSAPHIPTGPVPMAGGARPQLSLVPGMPEHFEDEPGNSGRPMAGACPVRADRPRGVLPREGRLDARGQADLPGLRGARRMPRLRAGPRRALRHLGRSVRAGAPSHQARHHLTRVAALSKPGARASDPNPHPASGRSRTVRRPDRWPPAPPAIRATVRSARRCPSPVARSACETTQFVPAWSYRGRRHLRE